MNAGCALHGTMRMKGASRAHRGRCHVENPRPPAASTSGSLQRWLDAEGGVRSPQLSSACIGNDGCSDARCSSAPVTSWPSTVYKPREEPHEMAASCTGSLVATIIGPKNSNNLLLFHVLNAFFNSFRASIASHGIMLLITPLLARFTSGGHVVSVQLHPLPCIANLEPLLLVH